MLTKIVRKHAWNVLEASEVQLAVFFFFLLPLIAAAFLAASSVDVSVGVGVEQREESSSLSIASAGTCKYFISDFWQALLLGVAHSTC